MYPAELKYTETHEYVRYDGKTATVGISSYALEHLGDIVFIDAPKVGDEVAKGTPCGNIESVKAVEDIYAPISGKITAVNADMINDPVKITENPYEAGWLFKVEVSNPSEIDELLDVKTYESKLEH